jgi:hypothetical protein
VGDLVAGDAAAGHQQVLYVLGQGDAVGHLEVAARGGHDGDAVAVQELGEDPDRVLELRLVQDVVLGQVVVADDLARLATADGCADGPQPCLLEAGRVLLQRLHRPHHALASLDLASGQVPYIGGVDPRHVDGVQVRNLAGVGEASPVALHAHVLGDLAGLLGLVEGLAQVGAELGRLLLAGFVAPVDGHPLEGLLGVDAERGAGPGCYVAVSGRVYDTLRQDRLASGLALGDDSLDGSVLQDDVHDLGVQERNDVRLLDHQVGDVLEDLGVQYLVVVHLEAGVHVLGAPLELGPDAAGVHGLLGGPIPGDGAHHGLGDDTPEAAVALHQHDLGALARRPQRGSQAPGSSAYHQYVRLRQDGDRPRGLFDLLHVQPLDASR